MPNPNSLPKKSYPQQENAEATRGFETAEIPQEYRDARPSNRVSRVLELTSKAIALWSQRQPTSRAANNSAKPRPKEAHWDTSAYDEVIGALENLGSASPRQIAQATGLSMPTVQRHLRALIKEGTVTKHGSTRSVRYQLTTST
ncbi:MAG: winged helix-turn-helix domain-containing protein [Puniceicoccales bacterium]